VVTPRLLYALAALILFAIEVLIALLVRDTFIRPYVGDVLAVALVYCALRAAMPLALWPAIITTLVIAFAIEFAQLLNLFDVLGLRSNRIAATVLGGSFDVMDLIAYAAGAFLIIVIETVRKRRLLKP
jgi:glycopeptide antibiotics resistance protein